MRPRKVYRKSSITGINIEYEPSRKRKHKRDKRKYSHQPMEVYDQDSTYQKNNLTKSIIIRVKNQKGVGLPLVNKGFNVFAELKKKREKEKYPPGFIYNGTMGKIKEDGLIKKLSNGYSIDSDMDNETYES